MQTFYSTKRVARILGVQPGTIVKSIWQGRCPSPAKSPGGEFLWTPGDIEKAAWVFHKANRLQVVELMKGLSDAD